MIDNDYVVLISRLIAIYGGSWFVLSRHRSGEGVFEKAVFTIIIVHFCAYFTFLFHFCFGLFYTPISSIFVFWAGLFLVRLLLSKTNLSIPEKMECAKDKRREVVIWAIFLFYFLLLYFRCSYRIADEGGAYHALLNLWKFNRDTFLPYPDVSQIVYGLKTSILFFHPAFFANCLLLNCGVSHIDHAISGFAIVHFISVMGMMLFIHLLLKEITGNTSFSFICLLLFATMRPRGGYSFLFQPDYNSFIWILCLGSLYYIIRIGKRFSSRDLWLIVVCVLAGINNRIWLASFFLGFLLPFVWMLSIRVWQNRREFYNWRLIFLFVLSFGVGAYWSIGVFEMGSISKPFGVYQSALETGYGAGDLIKYFSPFRLLSEFQKIVSAVVANLHVFYFKAFSSKYGGASFLPGYISALGVLGLGFLCWRYRKVKDVWRILLGVGFALFFTGFITPPGYPRAYLWVIPFFLLFATIGINELYRYISHKVLWTRGIPIVIGIVMGIYINICGILYLTGLEKKILNKWDFSPTPGMYNFFQDVNTLVYLRSDAQRIARDVDAVFSPDSKILHLVAEPGLDLDAFVKGAYWWKNFYFFPGMMGDDLINEVFPKYKNGEGITPCSLVKKNITIVDVPVNYKTLIESRKWTNEQIYLLERMREWFDKYPDIFEVISKGHAGRVIYIVHKEALFKRFGCIGEENSSLRKVRPKESQ